MKKRAKVLHHGRYPRHRLGGKSTVIAIGGEGIFACSARLRHCWVLAPLSKLSLKERLKREAPILSRAVGGAEGEGGGSEGWGRGVRAWRLCAGIIVIMFIKEY